MVDRRRLKRLKALAQKGGVVVHLRNGGTKVFSEHAPFYLWVADVEEGMEAEEGNFAPSEPTTPQGWEALRLRHALENATPQSRAGYEERFGRMFVWEESSYDEE
jgi:hypothetical protein